MKNKGFTLVELITVIILLGVLSLISFPIISDSIKNSKQKASDIQTKQIIRAAESWASENTSLLDETNRYTLNLSTLINSGYIDEDEVIDPKTGEILNSCIYIKYESSISNYKYTYSENCT